ncbi:hypothetical protein [Sunxiuqinia indica]|uniref:hypothetical protein n=1 Tax=Sunxiuqinia indica TaxID=2692584 RepID=UPI00135B330D|nr:hypothetical protein [Sunxiuqinia indica]
MSSKVNVSEIISKHKSTLQGGNGKLLKLDKKFFITYPIILGLILSFLVRIPNDGLVNIFAICLSIFIGLFLNLLVLIISFAENKLNIKDKSNRAILLEHTFYNITYTIVASLVGLGFLFLSNIDFFPANWKVDLNFINEKIIALKTSELTINTIAQFALYFVFYSIFIHIIMTLLMIVKRIFSLFKAEIDEINKVDKKQ